MKYFASAVIVCVALILLAGLYMVGSPAKERLRRFDEQRVQDLSLTQSYIIQYWQAKNSLPESLSDLTDETRGVSPRPDPVSKEKYSYETLSDLSFRLCANFATEVLASTAVKDGRSYPVPSGPYGIADGENWDHGAGIVCFDRAIDPDFLKQNAPVPVKGM